MARTPAQPEDRLDSWKEIAAYLRRDERTVQRWERQAGLPVHRTMGDHGSVFAYRGELDGWLKRQSSGAPETADGRQTDVASSAAVMVEVVEAAAPIAEGTRAGKPLRRRLGLLLMIGSVAALSAALAIAATVFYYTRPGPAARVTVTGKSILGWDANGRKSWEYGLSSSPVEANVLSFDSNGKRQYLLRILRFADSRRSGELDCFTSRGKLLWRYIPEMTLEFGNQVDKGPWAVVDANAGEGPHGPVLIAAISDFLWGHSAVEQIDLETGKGTTRFVNSGAVYRAVSVRSGNHDFIVAGGFNNEYDVGALAVIDADQQPPAVSPQTPGTRFACKSCANGQVKAYFLFPRSELNKLLMDSGPNSVMGLNEFPDHLEVSSEEISVQTMAIYDFRIEPEILPRNMAFGSTYWTAHRKLERELRLHHRAEECPEYVHGELVRMWTPEAGWSAMQVPYVLKGPIPQM